MLNIDSYLVEGLQLLLNAYMNEIHFYCGNDCDILCERILNRMIRLTSLKVIDFLH